MQEKRVSLAEKTGLNIEASLCTSLEWGAGESSYRTKIRRNILRDVSNQTNGLSLKTAQDKKNILDLSQPPIIEGLGLSIAHCKSIGGYLISSTHLDIGLDFEDQRRIKKDIVARVSSQQELKEAPDTSLIWGAKEAAYKALLRREQPETISGISVTNWKKLKENYWQFNARLRAEPTEILGQGIIWIETDLIATVFIAN